MNIGELKQWQSIIILGVAILVRAVYLKLFILHSYSFFVEDSKIYWVSLRDWRASGGFNYLISDMGTAIFTQITLDAITCVLVGSVGGFVSDQVLGRM